MKSLTKLDLKQALWNDKFRKLFPELKKEIESYLNNSSCPCNNELYEKLFTYTDRLKIYFPTKEIPDNKKSVVSNDKWTVINCKANELESKLSNLKSGKHYVSIARYEDEVTIVVKHLDYF